MKTFEADQKRLKSILLNYISKKADLIEKEKKEREDLISSLKDCYLLF
jgi:penicillin-binding protein-related factor A (putative recombinase)